MLTIYDRETDSDDNGADDKDTDTDDKRDPTDVGNHEDLDASSSEGESFAAKVLLARTCNLLACAQFAILWHSCVAC